MASIIVNTSDLNTNAEKIIDRVAVLETKINKIFKNIEMLPYTGEWVGNNAMNYAKINSMDKEIYLTYLKTVKEYANKMKQFAIETDELVSVNEKKV